MILTKTGLCHCLEAATESHSHRAKPRLQPCKVHPAFQPEQPQCLILYLSLRTRRSLLLSSLSRAVINTQSCRDLKETAGLLSTHNKLPHYRPCLCLHVLQSSLAGLGQGPEVCISGRLRLGARDHTLVTRLQEGWADSVSPPWPRDVLRFCPLLSTEKGAKAAGRRHQTLAQPGSRVLASCRRVQGAVAAPL